MKRKLAVILCAMIMAVGVSGYALSLSFSTTQIGNSLWISGDINGLISKVGESTGFYDIGGYSGTINRLGSSIQLYGDISGSIRPLGNSLLYDINGNTGIITPLGNSYIINGDIWGTIRKRGKRTYIDIW
ncbi:MAG: hypothetical protein J7M13_01715 [Synergistetes bacterium]|nr:hypothetical protein [Synergistota bacterium]